MKIVAAQDGLLVIMIGAARNNAVCCTEDIKGLFVPDLWVSPPENCLAHISDFAIAPSSKPETTFWNR